MVKLIYRGAAVERVGSAGFKIYADGDSLCVDAVGCRHVLFTHAHHYVEGAGGLGPIPGLRPVEEAELGAFKVRPVPAYNVNKKVGGAVPHPKGSGYGYLIEAGGIRIYIAGDTDLTPEVASIKGPDIFAVPIGGSTVMTPEEAADAVMSVRPVIAVPYHFSGRGQYARFRDIAQPYAQIVLL